MDKQPLRFFEILLFLSLFLSGCSAAAPKPSWSYDLKPFGVATEAQGSIMGFYPDLAFLSNRLLLVSVNKRVLGAVEPLFEDKPDSTLLLLDVDHHQLLASRAFAIEKAVGSIQALADGHFVLLNQAGVASCTSDLSCGVPLATSGPIFVSPRGTRLVIGGNSQTAQKLLDAQTFNILREFDSRREQAIPADSGVLIRRGQTVQILEEDKKVQLSCGGLGIWPEDRFLSDSRVAGFDNANRRLCVSNLDGTIAYEKAVKEPWNATLSLSAGGEVFALQELGYTRLNSIINFLDIDSGRPLNLERISTFRVDSGSELLRLQWDPRPYVGYLAVPALSPDGKKLAIIRSGRLQVFELPSRD